MASRTNVVSVDSVIADSRCQSRTGIDLALVQEYADAIKEGAELPPLSTIHADDGYYLYDGFHRLEAYRQAGTRNVVIEAEPGDVWDAIERSCAVNAIHGKRRTPADVKNAVGKILEVMHHRGVKWSQGEIAERCAVSQSTVSRILSDDSSYASAYDSAAPATTVSRNGKTYEMNTANIGKRPAATLDPGPENVDEETGEILDSEPPPYEEVDPTDPATFVTSAQPPKAAPRTPPRPSPASVSFSDYGPDHNGMSSKSLAMSIVAGYGEGFARRVARDILESAGG